MKEPTVSSVYVAFFSVLFLLLCVTVLTLFFWMFFDFWWALLVSSIVGFYSVAFSKENDGAEKGYRE